MWTDFHQESSKRWNLNASLYSAAQSVTGMLPPTSYLEWLKFVTNHEQTISDFRHRPIPRVHEEQIVMKAGVKKMRFLRVQVIVKVRRAYNPSHYIRLNPVCRLNARCTSISRNCMLLFVFPVSDKASWHNHIVFIHCFEPQYLC